MKRLRGRGGYSIENIFKKLKLKKLRRLLKKKIKKLLGKLKFTDTVDFSYLGSGF